MVNIACPIIGKVAICTEFCQFQKKKSITLLYILQSAGVGPGFPEGAWTHFRGRGPPMWVLFGENVCENERIGSRRGSVRRKILYVDPPMVYFHSIAVTMAV